MAYGFSVFLLPLSRVLGVSEPIACPGGTDLWRALAGAPCDWRIGDLDWIYTLFFVFLGCSAAVWGDWLERAGPRKAAWVAAACWSGGHLIGAAGIMTHRLWLVWLGCGVVGGIGLGLGYISPTSTLMRWFPDRRGLAAGLAVMGFGGGAMIGAPLADTLMNAFSSPTSVGAWQTFAVLAVIYFLAMGAGATGFRLPPPGWQPPTRPSPHKFRLAVVEDVPVRDATRTPQLWLLWAVLCFNVSAGLGVLGMAALMLQEVFGGLLLGLPGLTLAELDPGQRHAAAAISAGFIGMLSLFNIAGRIAWALVSDRIGRKATFSCISLLGILLYAGVPSAIEFRNLPLFAILLCLMISAFGGAFATMPAYVADIFGARFASAIQGRILTAWSTAGLIGPMLVSRFRDAALAAGVPRASAYNTSMYVLVGLLALGFLANAMIRPIRPGRVTQANGNPANPQAASVATCAAANLVLHPDVRRGPTAYAPVVAAWLAVGLPLAWGTWMTATRALKLLGVG